MIRPAAISLFALLGACAATPESAQPRASAPDAVPVGTSDPGPRQPAAAAVASTEDARLQAFLDAAFDARAALNPQFLTTLGSRDRYGELDDYTPAADERQLALLERQLAQMKREF
ncbi:MAG: hypothetical protein KY449_07485, partial [Proteobacteria bacterium]|nr:hypothetical protein [Pseudomonadota bacterium]